MASRLTRALGIVKSADPISIAEQAFARIAAQFPCLMMVRERHAPVELAFSIPVQPGLSQHVWLNLQNNDELHFNTGHFWLEWFPCTEAAKVESYVKAVCGFLSGSYRIIEHYQWGKCVKAQLQEPVGPSWRTVGTWRTLLSFLPLPKLAREVRNAQQGAPADRP